MSDVLREERDDRDVVTLTFDRPDVRNAFDARLMAALADTATALTDDPSVRAVVLTGAGPTFSAGADLHWMSSTTHQSVEDNVADAWRFESMLRAVHDLPMPVIARVDGHAFGGGAGLLACADITIATNESRFGFTETRLGIAPAIVSAYVQPRIGLANARRYFLTGERFDAERALQMGLVHEICDPGDLDEVLGALVAAVLAAGPRAQRETKRLIAANEREPDPAASVERRVELIAGLRVGAEGQEGMAAFLDRRRPSWVPREPDT